jgi:WD40 repeat protein
MEAQKLAGTVTGPAGPLTPVATLRGHVSGVIALAFSPDRGLLVSASRDGTGRVWELSSKRPAERGSFRQHGDPFHSLAVSPNGRAVAAGSGTANGLIWLYDVSGKGPLETSVLRGARGTVETLAFSPDGKLVAGGGEDGTLRVWETAPGSKGDARAILHGHTGPIRAMSFAPDGYGIATGGRDSTVRLWSVSRIRSWERAVLPQVGKVDALAYSPDGKTLAVACRGHGVAIWDVTSVKPFVRTVLGGPKTDARLVLFPSEPGVLVGVREGPRVLNWDVRSGSTLREWELPAERGPGFALTPDGRYLGTGSADGMVEVYRVAEKRS